MLDDEQLHEHDRIERGATDAAIKGRNKESHKAKIDALEQAQVDVMRRQKLDQQRADRMIT